MAQPTFTCPFCKSQAWRTRLMFWRHIHECLKQRHEYAPVVGVDSEELAVMSLAK